MCGNEPKSHISRNRSSWPFRAREGQTTGIGSTHRLRTCRPTAVGPRPQSTGTVDVFAEFRAPTNRPSGTGRSNCGCRSRNDAQSPGGFR